jgi:hypothetical protein
MQAYCEIAREICKCKLSIKLYLHWQSLACQHSWYPRYKVYLLWYHAQSYSSVISRHIYLPWPIEMILWLWNPSLSFRTRRPRHVQLHVAVANSFANGQKKFYNIVITTLNTVDLSGKKFPFKLVFSCIQLGGKKSN